jgi:hypothetical protein
MAHQRFRNNSWVMTGRFLEMTSGPGKPHMYCTVACLCILCPSFAFLHPGCWGPSASEGPQKHDLTMFLEYDTWTGTFGLRSKPQCEEAQIIRRMAQSRSYAQGSFGVIAEKETDIKGKRLFRPRWITIESLANVKGMSVILHGLRPVPINRWTVLPYCSRWLGICFCVTLVLLHSFKPKVHL